MPLSATAPPAAPIRRAARQPPSMLPAILSFRGAPINFSDRRCQKGTPVILIRGGPGWRSVSRAAVFGLLPPPAETALPVDAAPGLERAVAHREPGRARAPAGPARRAHA